MFFDENIFINNIIKNCSNINDINDINNSYDINFNNLILENDIDLLFNIYCTDKNDIEDAKIRYGNNYKELKINLILYNNLLRYLRIK